MHGARPRQTGRECPPVIDNPVFRDAEEIAADRDAAEISAIRHPSRNLRLSPGRRIFMEEERYELCQKKFRRTVYEMTVKARRTSGRRWIR